MKRCSLVLGKYRSRNGYPVACYVNWEGVRVCVSSGVFLSDPANWQDGTVGRKEPNWVVKRSRLRNLNCQIEAFILSHDDYDVRRLRAALRSIVSGKPLGDAVGCTLFLPVLEEYANLQQVAGTRRVYQDTYNKIKEFDERCTFEGMGRRWLMAFETHCGRTMSVNGMAIHFRNIRTVFNYAIDEKITTHYPFRKYKIRREQTRHRALTVEMLRDLAAHEDGIPKYRDMFMLMFYLIGINAVDLFALAGITTEGRVEYRRAKTHRLYSIRVEPEALEIINCYRGRMHLLSVADEYKDYHNFIHRQALVLRSYTNADGTPMFPDGISSYWARHTWATLAAELDIPKETIAAALGHSSGSVTDIYIRFNRDKIDDANRRVIDYALYGRR